MDPQRLRRALMRLGLPSAGTPQKLQSRLAAVAAAVAQGTPLEAAVEVARKLR